MSTKAAPGKLKKKRSGSNQISHALQRLSCFHFEMWGWSRLAWASGSAFILKCGVGPWLVWAGGPAFIWKCGAGPWLAWAGGSAFILKCGAGPWAGGSDSRFRQIWC